jgi:hypothetical protein
MPLPQKRKGEPRDKFMSRCITDPKAREEFKDIKQRIAVCDSLYKKNKKK